ncbi:hypothetical protein B5J92_01485 [Moraxella atlantae]|nr:hypothetical protein B5J92_01485 [Moraxella atlantae]
MPSKLPKPCQDWFVHSKGNAGYQFLLTIIALLYRIYGKKLRQNAAKIVQRAAITIIYIKNINAVLAFFSKINCVCVAWQFAPW